MTGPHRRRLVVVLAAVLAAAAGARAGEGPRDRIAVWGFPAAADDAEGASLGERLATLTEVELARRGVEVVERRRFESILQEHKLAFTQFADAEKAVRAGKLVRADVVLVGSVLRQGRKRAVTMKAVETASGKVLDARAGTLSESGLKGSAADAAAFIMAARGREIGKRVFLAVGGFEDLSLNDRFLALGRELRTRLVHSLSREPSTTLVEREHVEPLLLELGLSRSGLAAPDFGRTDAAPALLIVDGVYRSYSEGEVFIGMNLRLERVGRPWRVARIDARPGEELHEKTRRAVLAFLSGPRTAPGLARTDRRAAEAKAHFERGMQQSRIKMGREPYPCILGSLGGAGWSANDPKRRRNIENAISSFESAVLLAPSSCNAKLLLAVCLADPEIREFRRARRLLEEAIAGSTDPALRQLATVQLGQTFIDAQRKVPNRSPSASPEMEAAYRQAIGIWLKLADGVESCVFKDRILGIADAVLHSLYERRLASLEESRALAKRCIEARCRVLIERTREDPKAYVMARSFQHYWGHMYGHREEGSFDHCMLLAAGFAARYPRLEHILYFGILGMVPDKQKLAVAQKALGPVLDRPEELMGLGPCYHDMMPSIVNLYAQAGRWEDAARVCELIAAYYAERYPQFHARPANEVMRARCYREMGRWREALAIYERLGEVEVNTSYYRILGRKVSLRAEIALCREHLGKETQPQLERTTLGAPVVSLPDGRREGRFNSPAVVTALAAVGKDLWIGCGPRYATYGARLPKNPEEEWGRKGGLYRFDKAAGRLDDIELDASAASRWITCLEPQGTDLWVGTFGGGLYRLSTRTYEKKRWSEDEGLVSNCVTALCLARPGELWVGFSVGWLGGCGKLDARSGSFFSMLPRLDAGEVSAPAHSGPLHREPLDRAPVKAVSAIRSSAGRWVWVAVHQKGLQRYDLAARTWDTATNNVDFRTNPRKYGGPIASTSHHLSCLAIGDGFVAVGAGFQDGFYGGTVDIYHHEQATWSRISLSDGLPAGNVHSLAASGRTLWIGGRKYPRRHGGTRVSDCYVASYDLATKRLSRIYVGFSGKRSPVLLADGDTLWVGAGNKVYRITVPGGKGGRR